MQDRYTADIGDYVKYALLRALTPGRKLGVAWYLFPDEGHNSDGKHISYLKHPGIWRNLDPALFDALAEIASATRSVRAVQQSSVLGGAKFSDRPLNQGDAHWRDRSDLRAEWFSSVLGDLADCDLVFADPDNGLIDDSAKRRSQGKFGKQMPLHEALTLARGRSALIYHHNTRFPGGHDVEVRLWQERLGAGTAAIRANAFSCRTFFLVNPTGDLIDRARDFCQRWRQHKVTFVNPI